MEEKDLERFPPPHYDNLNFDAQSENLPSAPDDVEDFEYEGAAEVLMAPTTPPFLPNLEPRTLNYNVPSLVYEDIYDACIRYVKDHYCYSSRFVRQMNLTEIKNDSAFFYIVETFCEKRESVIACFPYTGQYIDGPENGPPPAPWDIFVQPPAMFQNGKIKMEIPHTAYVKPCEVCVSNGRIRCDSCSGRGGRKCFRCHGRGRTMDGHCSFCHGSGRKRCLRCKGHGQVKCKRCDGRGNIKSCRLLIVTWHNFSEEFMSNMHNLPPKYVKTVTGYKVLLEEQNMLTPIINASDESINEASLRILKGHYEAFKNMRILRQRHVLRSIPLTKVFYQWRGKEGEFYVYGKEKNVYFQEYPQKCCCCTCL